MVNVNHYVNLFLRDALNGFIRDNINTLVGLDLVEFYRQLFKGLKEIFWWFMGI